MIQCVSERFKQTDLAPYIATTNYCMKQIINREGINNMTIINETTNNAVMLDTPDGTVVRLIDNYDMTAKVGALGVVDRSLTEISQGPYLPISWLKGHVADHQVKGELGTQDAGAYLYHRFEVNEFQVGDRVRASGLLCESGFEGVIEAIPATNGDDCIVAVDSPYTVRLSYKFSYLEKVATSCYAEGEVVVLAPGDKASPGWNGLRAKVVKDDGGKALYVKPLDERPDGFELGRCFYWPRKYFRPFDKKTDFRVGDIVETHHFGINGKPAKAVVTSLSTGSGGDIEVNWTEGSRSLVGSGPLGASRYYLTLAGVSSKGFEFEADQEVAPEALGDLPDGTILVVKNGVAVIAYVGESD